MGGQAVGLSARLAPIAVLLAANLLTTPAWAEVFRVGEVDGLFDVSLAYGLLTRTESRELNFIGIGNAGEAASVNVDDGDLNYDKGVVSNGVRATAELTLKWRNFGSYVRGYGFYDFETELDEREHSALSSDADDLVGRGGDFQDHYLNAALDLGSVPVQLRVGNQVLNWGESGFLRFGVGFVNPLDLTALSQPMTTAEDAFVRQGMLWGAANLTETIAVEGLYQYDWQEVRSAPVGWFFSRRSDRRRRDRSGVFRFRPVFGPGNEPRLFFRSASRNTWIRPRFHEDPLGWS